MYKQVVDDKFKFKYKVCLIKSKDHTFVPLIMHVCCIGMVTFGVS